MHVAALILIAFTQPEGAPPPAGAAEVEDPRPREALAACASGRVSEGIAILAELFADTRAPSFLYNQGRCYQQNGQLEPAAERFREYLRVGTAEQPADRARAERFIEEIDQTLARRRRAEAERAARATRPATPASPGPPAAAADLPRVAVTPPPAGAAADPDRARPLRVASVVLGTASVLAVGTGVMLGLRAEALERQVEREAATEIDGRRIEGRLATGPRLATWQWVGYGVGLAAAAGAVTTYWLARRRSAPAEAQRRVQVAFTPLVAPGGAAGVLTTRF